MGDIASATTMAATIKALNSSGILGGMSFIEWAVPKGIGTTEPALSLANSALGAFSSRPQVSVAARAVERVGAPTGTLLTGAQGVAQDALQVNKDTPVGS